MLEYSILIYLMLRVHVRIYKIYIYTYPRATPETTDTHACRSLLLMAAWVEELSMV